MTSTRFVLCRLPRELFLLLAAMLLAVLGARVHAAPVAEPEYFHLRQGVTFYIANTKGDAFDIAIDLKDINTYCQGAQTAMVKLYAPDGSILANAEIADDGIESGGYDQAWAGWDHEMWALGAEPLFRWDAFSDPRKLEKMTGAKWAHKIEKPAKGVYQLQIAGCDDHFVKLAISNSLKFGVLGHPDFLSGRGEQFRTSYLYVPKAPWYTKGRDQIDLWLVEHAYPHTRKLTLFNGNSALEIKDICYNTTGKSLTADQAMGRGEVSLKGVAPGTVLKLVNEGTGDFLIRIHGIPQVYCPDEETAKFIHGGVIEIPNGPVVSFPWQEELWNAVKDLKAEDLTVKPGEWNKIAAPDVAKLVLHQWETDNDPKTVDASIKAAMDALAKIQPFSMEKVLEDPALTAVVGETLYLYPIKGNGLYQNKALRNLLTLRLIKQWYRYKGGEVIFDPGELNVAYAQGFHWNNWEPVLTLKDALDPAVLKAFQKGAFNIGQRMFYANGLELVLSNGRTTIPMNLYHAYLITGDEKLKDLSMRYLRRMVNALDGPHAGGSKSGYFREHFAADGGYCTYPLFQLGRMWNISGDPEVFSAMDNLCKWINFITLPNGKGGYTGPTSWHARIAMGAFEHMWGEGYKYVAKKSQWAANLYHMARPGPAFHNVADPEMEPGKPAGDSKILILDHLTRGILPKKPLPAESETPFFEDVGGGHEFFAVRRGNYYALAYAGKRVPFWMDVSLGGQNSFNGGGITGLSVKGATGAVIVGRVNREYGWPIEEWNSLAVPVVVGQMSNGQFFNTGVSRNTPTWDAAAWTLKTTGECVTAPVNYVRDYTFNEGSIAASVTVSDAALNRDVFQYREFFRKQHVHVSYAWELVPFEFADMKVTASDAAGKDLGAVGETPVDNVSVVELNNGRGGVRLKLDKPRTVKLSAKASTALVYKEGGHATDGRCQAVQIKMTDKMEVGGKCEMKYEIVPFGK